MRQVKMPKISKTSMKYILVLSLLSLACVAQVAPAVIVADTSPKTAVSEVTITPIGYVTADVVNIRDIDGNTTGRYIYDGDPLYGQVNGDWVNLLVKGQVVGKVWRGCTSLTDEYLGCD